MTKSSMPRGEVIYSFNHKSDQEYFASRHVVRLLETSTDSLREILQCGTQTSQASIEAHTRTSLQQLPLSSTTSSGPQHEELSDGDEVEIMASSLVRSIPIFEKITDVVTSSSPSDKAKMQSVMPNVIPMFLRKVALITMGHMNSHEAAEFVNFLRSDLPNYLPNLMDDVIPRVMEEVPHMNTLVEVLQHVIRDLSAHNQILLQTYWPEIKEILEEMGTNFSTWRDMVLNSPRDTWLVRSVAQAAIENNTEWKIMSGREISAAALMLRHAQPRLLEVRLSSLDTVNQDRWTQVIQRRDGDLKLYLFDGYWDDFLTPLLNSRCRLVFFAGEVATSSSLEALASVSCDDAQLHVSVPAPLNFCSLENKRRDLWVYAPTLETDARGEGVSVLPRLPRPKLILFDLRSEPWMEVVRTITTYAPFGNRYELLKLQDCELTDSELDQVVDVLQQRGVRTAGEGGSRWVKMDEDCYYELIIPDDLPELTTLKLDD